MNDSDEIGVLVTGGAAWSSEEAARAIGLTDADSVRLVDRLIGLGALSRDHAGRIACLPMVDDAKRRQRLKDNGTRGGNPKLTNKSPPRKRAVKQVVNQEVNQLDDYDSVSDSQGVKDSEGGAGGVRRQGGDFVIKRNAVYESLAACFYPSGVPKGKSGLVAAAAVEIVKTFKGTPDDVKLRHANIPRTWSGTTPQGLVDHWDDLGPNGTLRSSPPTLFGAAPAQDSPARVKAKPGKYDNLKVIRVDNNDPSQFERRDVSSSG